MIRTTFQTCPKGYVSHLLAFHTYIKLAFQTAVVTGGTQGIDFEVAKALAISHARVLLLSRKSENGAAAIESINQERVARGS